MYMPLQLPLPAEVEGLIILILYVSCTHHYAHLCLLWLHLPVTDCFFVCLRHHLHLASVKCKICWQNPQWSNLDCSLKNRFKWNCKILYLKTYHSFSSFLIYPPAKLFFKFSKMLLQCLLSQGFFCPVTEHVNELNHSMP